MHGHVYCTMLPSLILLYMYIYHTRLTDICVLRVLELNFATCTWKWYGVDTLFLHLRYVNFDRDSLIAHDTTSGEHQSCQTFSSIYSLFVPPSGSWWDLIAYMHLSFVRTSEKTDKCKRVGESPGRGWIRRYDYAPPSTCNHGAQMQKRRR